MIQDRACSKNLSNVLVQEATAITICPYHLDMIPGIEGHTQGQSTYRIQYCFKITIVCKIVILLTLKSVHFATRSVLRTSLTYLVMAEAIGCSLLVSAVPIIANIFGK